MITESQLRRIITAAVKKAMNESYFIGEDERPTFGDFFNRSKAFHRKYDGYGFELRKDGEWKYGDIEYDPNAQTMSCLGVTIKVSPNMTISDAEDDLFEALLDAGFETDF